MWGTKRENWNSGSRRTIHPCFVLSYACLNHHTPKSLSVSPCFSLLSLVSSKSLQRMFKIRARGWTQGRGLLRRPRGEPAGCGLRLRVIVGGGERTAWNLSGPYTYGLHSVRWARLGQQQGKQVGMRSQRKAPPGEMASLCVYVARRRPCLCWLVLIC